MGFVRFGFRDYDTYTSRWTAPDPIGDAGGDSDWYGYCLDDPVNGVDPLGLARKGYTDLKFAPGMREEGLLSITGKACFPIWGQAFKKQLGQLDDKANTKLRHEQLFFEDEKGGSVGLFPEGVKRDTENAKDYTFEKEQFDDKKMRRAVKSLPKQDYSLLGVGKKKNNCQDYMDKVTNRYRREK